MATRKITCQWCEAEVSKNIAGLNRKLLAGGRKCASYYCLNCLAEYLECSVKDLEEKIEQFKSEGCKLFS